MFAIGHKALIAGWMWYCRGLRLGLAQSWVLQMVMPIYKAIMTYAPPVAEPGLILHQAFFWLKKPGSDVDRSALIAGLRTLGDIPQLRNLSIATPAATEARDVVDSSFDVLETMLFATLEDQLDYQTHPIHLAFIVSCEHLWERVLVYDGLIK
jgi:hypothetical protein